MLSRVLASWDELSVDVPVQVQVRPAEPNFLFDFVLADPADGQVGA